jgi:hypothetical protein
VSVFEWQAYDEREIAWRKAFILFEHLTYPCPIVFVVSVSALHEPIIFVDRELREPDWMLAAIVTVIRTPPTEIPASPPQLADDDDHLSFGGPRQEGGGECCKTVFECIKAISFGFAVGATNVV